MPKAPEAQGAEASEGQSEARGAQGVEGSEGGESPFGRREAAEPQTETQSPEAGGGARELLVP